MILSVSEIKARSVLTSLLIFFRGKKMRYKLYKVEKIKPFTFTEIKTVRNETQAIRLLKGIKSNDLSKGRHYKAYFYLAHCSFEEYSPDVVKQMYEKIKNNTSNVI